MTTVTIKRRLFMIFNRDFPYQIRHDFILKKPKIVLSYMQIIPGPVPSHIPIFKTQTTDHEYIRCRSLMEAVRYAKKLRNIRFK